MPITPYLCVLIFRPEKCLCSNKVRSYDPFVRVCVHVSGHVSGSELYVPAVF